LHQRTDIIHHVYKNITGFKKREDDVSYFYTVHLFCLSSLRLLLTFNQEEDEKVNTLEERTIKDVRSFFKSLDSTIALVEESPKLF